MGELRSETTTKAETTLRILATSDAHMALTGWDARNDTTDPTRGMDRLANAIAHARADAPGPTVLFDNGDALQGSPVADLCAQQIDTAEHPWPAILNTLGYDAIGLGNHDFDYGIDFLEAILTQINAPALCGSIAKGRIKGVLPFALLNRSLHCSDGQERALSIGVTSLLPPQTMIWSFPNLSGRISFYNGVVSARQAVAKLKEIGADVVVVLCHSGMSSSSDPGAENFAALVADHVPEIDALVLGHTHRIFPEPTTNSGTGSDSTSAVLNSIPAVMPGYGAEYLGAIDLHLSWRGARWSVSGHSVSLLTSHCRQPDTTIGAIAAPFIAATKLEMERELTTTGHGFHSFFEMLQSGTAGALVAEAMQQTVAEQVAGTALDKLPLLASVAPVAVGGQGGVNNFLNVPPGKVLSRHVATICPFLNWIWAAILTGADLWKWAGHASMYFAPESGRASKLVNTTVPCFVFDMLHGLETTIDPFAPAQPGAAFARNRQGSGRIRSLEWDGLPVDPEARFLVAMTSYRGAGGGAFPGILGNKTMFQTKTKVSDSLRKYLKNHPIGDEPARSVWRFAPDLNEDVLIETSPAAAEHLNSIAHFDPKPLGFSDDGFLRLQVRL